METHVLPNPLALLGLKSKEDLTQFVGYSFQLCNLFFDLRYPSC